MEASAKNEAENDLEGAPLAGWHKPCVAKIDVGLDTAASPGSGIDFEQGDTFISDARVKHGVSGIVDALSGVRALRGVTYRYRTAEYPELGLSDEPQIGFVAQELEQVFPELVVTRKDGFKAINYAQLVPVLVEAIKQQQAMIEDLKAQVSELKQG